MQKKLLHIYSRKFGPEYSQQYNLGNKQKKPTANRADERAGSYAMRTSHNKQMKNQ